MNTQKKTNICVPQIEIISDGIMSQLQMMLEKQLFTIVLR